MPPYLHSTLRGSSRSLRAPVELWPSHSGLPALFGVLGPRSIPLLSLPPPPSKWRPPLTPHEVGVASLRPSRLAPAPTNRRAALGSLHGNARRPAPSRPSRLAPLSTNQRAGFRRLHGDARGPAPSPFAPLPPLDQSARGVPPSPWRRAGPAPLPPSAAAPQGRSVRARRRSVRSPFGGVPLPAAAPPALPAAQQRRSAVTAGKEGEGAVPLGAHPPPPPLS